MKKTAKTLLGLSMALSLTGLAACADPAGPTQVPTELPVPPTISQPATTLPEPSTEAPTEPFTEAATLPFGPALSEAELQQFRALFEADFSLYSQALTSYFDGPEDVDLVQFFYNGHLAHRKDPSSYLPPTELELTHFREHYGEDHMIFQLDATVISEDEMNADLQEVFGLTLEQTHQVGLDKMEFCAASGRYFLFHGDANAMTAQIQSGHWLDVDETRVALTYPGGFNEECTAVMENRDGHWYLVSNHSPMEESFK